MRRFATLHDSGISKWPEEFREDFASLLASRQYNKGSLMQSSLCYDSLIPFALPPVFESALEPSQLRELYQMFEAAGLIDSDDYDILPLFSQCAVIKIGEYVLSSRKSRFTTCSVIMAQTINKSGILLADIHYFLKCDVRIRENDEIRYQSFWLVAISFYYPHECKVWFGSPTEVWSAITRPDIEFLPLSHIRSRVSYSKQDINFGRLIGTDSVLIITPLQLLY